VCGLDKNTFFLLLLFILEYQLLSKFYVKKKYCLSRRKPMVENLLYKSCINSIFYISYNILNKRFWSIGRIENLNSEIWNWIMNPRRSLSNQLQSKTFLETRHSSENLGIIRNLQVSNISRKSESGQRPVGPASQDDWAHCIADHHPIYFFLASIWFYLTLISCKFRMA